MVTMVRYTHTVCKMVMLIIVRYTHTDSSQKELIKGMLSRLYETSAPLRNQCTVPSLKRSRLHANYWQFTCSTRFHKKYQECFRTWRILQLYLLSSHDWPSTPLARSLNPETIFKRTACFARLAVNSPCSFVKPWNNIQTNCLLRSLKKTGCFIHERLTCMPTRYTLVNDTIVVLAYGNYWRSNLYIR